MKNPTNVLQPIAPSILAIVFLFLFFKVQGQDPGPYYFVSDNINGAEQFFSESTESYGGIRMSKGLNVLANVLGDDPQSLLPAGGTLVPVRTFQFETGSGSLQPFAFTVNGSNEIKNLPLGPHLQGFLNDPLGGASFDLTLPFVADNIGLSDHSGAVRAPGGSIFHYAIDFDMNGHTFSGFDIIAPADGVIEGYANGSSMTIRHRASNGKEFLTYYQHMDPASVCDRWENGAQIRRGEKIGRVESYDEEGNPSYTHLHFGVAVRGPAATINGVNIPEMWYEIDPFGVYDYRRNPEDAINYNYLPYNNMTVNVQGIVHAYVFRTNPPLGSLLVPKEMYCQQPTKVWMGQCFCDAIGKCSMWTPWRICWWQCIGGLTCIITRISILALYVLAIVAGVGEIRANLLKGPKQGPISRVWKYAMSRVQK
jgi:murein DD-endopeptidase MepM/ murein hydrolase activator NlpD